MRVWRGPQPNRILTASLSYELKSGAAFYLA